MSIDADELERALFLIGGSSSKSQFDQERVEELLLALDRIERRDKSSSSKRDVEIVGVKSEASGTESLSTLTNDGAVSNDKNEPLSLISTNPNAIVASTTSTSSDNKDMSSSSSSSGGSKENGKKLSSKVKNSIKVKLFVHLNF